MMDQFCRVYRFGGMSLYHSGYWLAEKFETKDGTYYREIKFLEKAYF